MVNGSWAWVTCAAEDRAAVSAVVLAASLRNVRTASRLVAFTTFQVKEDLRERLKEVFDLVIPVEKEGFNGMLVENYAKIQGFELLNFQKCVYLSPDSLVVRNCDEIFEKTDSINIQMHDGFVDTSIYIYTPSLELSRSLKTALRNKYKKDGSTKFSDCFRDWIINNFPSYGELDKMYQGKFCLESEDDIFGNDAAIIHFEKNHPYDMLGVDITTVKNITAADRLLLEKWMDLHEKNMLSNTTQLFQHIRNKYQHEPIAIVGMSCRLPGANNLDEFWDILAKGQDAIQKVPSHRWLKNQTFIPLKSREVQAGFLKSRIDEFDYKFFGMSPREAMFLDPQQRLLHEITWEALEDAMIDPLTLRGTLTGIFVGSWIYDYKEISIRTPDPDFFRVYTGNSLAAEAARLSHFYETIGPSIATESGCSSSIAAVDMACKSLRNRDSNLALACGVNLIINPFDNTTLSFVVAPDGKCKTFDAKADGFGRAEGCGVLALKRYSDAVRDGDKIWGLIRGSALVQEGLSKSFGTPTVHCEALAMELALKDAGVEPKDVSYIEAHGTGTPIGDPMEVAAISKVYSKSRNEVLHIGSVKTNVGHTESASGITGIMKVLLSMKNELIPPHKNLDTLNPEIHLESIPAQIPLIPTPWPRTLEKPRIAGVSSFGISGTDGHVIIEEPPQTVNTNSRIISNDMERPFHFLKLSAKSEDSLENLINQYALMMEDGSIPFEDIAFTANTGRASFNHRAVIIAKDSAEALENITGNRYMKKEVNGTGQKLCFLFTGQGSQYLGMAQELYSTSYVFKTCFDVCHKILQDSYGIDIQQVIWNRNGTQAEAINQTLYSQISIFVVEFCLFKMWETWGVKPDYVLGHSLGEFAAAVASGALDLLCALKLVTERSLLIDKLENGRMIVVKTDERHVKELLEIYQQQNHNHSFRLDIAARNSHEQTVLSGGSEHVEAYAQFCEQKQIKFTILASTHAFHSHHMESILNKYRSIVSDILKRKKVGSTSQCQYISGVDGKLVETSELLKSEYWIRHCREKVNFIDGCQSAINEGCTIFLEVGPHPVLSALTMVNTEGKTVACLPSLRKTENNWSTILTSLGKLYLSDWNGKIDWAGFDKFYKRNKVSSLPFYPFSRVPMWVDVRPENWSIHPLIGKLVSNPSSTTIFDGQLSTRRLPFLQDHLIGNMVVFPGAAFLEMCLSAGHATTQGFTDSFTHPRRPVGLQNLQILSPLVIPEGKSCIVQTVANHVEHAEADGGSTTYSVGVHHWLESDSKNLADGKWVLHAKANFLPVVSSGEKQNFSIIQKETDEDGLNIKEFYENLPQVGLRFGPSFQSLEFGWKAESNGAYFKVKTPEIQEHVNELTYMIHPVVADAMLQATMLWMNKGGLSKKKLFVPIQIGEFLWYPGVDNQDKATKQELYIYCMDNDDDNAKCGTCISTFLLDKNSQLLATMRQVEFAETTVKLIEGMIHQQSTHMPKIWEEKYRPTPGPRQTCVVPEALQEDVHFSSEDIEKIHAYNDTGEEELQFYNHVCQITWRFVLKALYDLGWNPEQGVTYTAELLCHQLLIQDVYCNHLDFFLRKISEEQNFLKKVSDNEYMILDKNTLPSNNQLRDYLNQVISPDEPNRGDYSLLSEVGKNLALIYSGKVNPLTILFPEDESKPSAKKIYDIVVKWLDEANRYIHNKILRPIPNKVKASSNPNAILHILEVGAGTGTFAKTFLKEFLPEVKANDGVLEYTYTDISAVFFQMGKETLKEYLDVVVFKKLNIEEDPLAQGFCPEYFDMVICGEVLHATRDLKESLKNIRKLLKPGGFVEIMETTVQDFRATFAFGLLEGYWRFQDYDLRPNHATLSGPLWEKALLSCGYQGVHAFPIYNGVHSTVVGFAGGDVRCLQVEQPKYHWIVFGNGNDDNFTESLRKRVAGTMDRKVIVVSRPSSNAMYVESEIKAFLNDILDQPMYKDGTVTLEGIIYLWGLVEEDNHDQTRISLPFLSLIQIIIGSSDLNPSIHVVVKGTNHLMESQVLNPSPSCLLGLIKSTLNECPLLKLSALDLSPDDDLETCVEEIYLHLWGSRRGYFFRDGKRFISRLVAKKIPNDNLELPRGTNRFKLILPSSKQISDLEFTHLDKYTLDDGELEIQVKAASLNFRDIFTVLKPTAAFEGLNAIGMDSSGVVTALGKSVTRFKVGDRVVCVNLDPNLALPSHVKVPENFAVPLPPHLTFCEGATLPAVYMTALYCLVHVAKMKEGETVLIHTASGGVGLCAIQIARRFNVNIIATAGSKRKRTFLRNLGLKHVFHSRNTEYGQEIMKVTNGKGVDIILNSLTGPGFKEASLDALAKHGRFIEMSKLTVWSEEEVKEIRPDVEYRIVDLPTVDRTTMEGFLENLKTNFKDCNINPLPYERFDALNIRGALKYLQRAKHIGKVICVMPEMKLIDSKLTYFTPLFNEDSTYIVTGGLGGIGFVVVKWMLENGAKHIAISSRRQASGKVLEEIEMLNKSGKHVKAFSVDVGNYDQCVEMFQTLKDPKHGFPTIRGVMHAAGVLEDATLPSQTWDKFKYTYHPKVSGGWNLHQLTKDLPLEHFVLFSSLAALVGPPGQANHAASCLFEDTLAYHRISLGLPATSINWGNWGEVGVATELDFPGIRPITTVQGLLALETAMRTNTRQMAVSNVESFSLVSQIIPELKHYVEDHRLFSESKSAMNIVTSDEFWAEMDAANEREGKVEVFKKYIKIFARNILKMDADEPIDDHVDFQSLGVDSLMMLEMKNSMQNVLGSRMTITAAHVKDCNNAHLLANRMVDVLEAKEDEKHMPTLAELRELILEDCQLTKNFLPENVEQPAKNVEYIRTVLITGATGTLGPYILQDLSKMQSISKIYCLVRKTGKVSVQETLKSVLNKKEMLGGVNMEKVEVVAGDIALERLGLSDDLYDKMAEEVDAIVHCAVKADHSARYWKAPEDRLNHIRNVNVIGTARILQLATVHRTKHVFYASTLLVVPTVNEDGTLSEDWQELNAFGNLSYNAGYILSKHIAEQLVKQAADLGVPCKSFRFGGIAGDAKTGRIDFLKTHYTLRMLAFLKLSSMPEIITPAPIITPNMCSEVMVKVCFNKDALTSDVYNVTPPQPQLEQVFVSVAEKELGIKVETVPMSEFMRRLKAEGDDSFIAPLKSLYAQDSDRMMEMAFSLASVQQCMGSNKMEDFFVSKKIAKLLPGFYDNIEPTETIMRRDIRFAKKSGVLDMIGIKTH